MQLFARKVNNFRLFDNHAWYVPGVGGIFALLGWTVLGMLIGAMVQGLLIIFLPMEVVKDYGAIITYPLQFLPAMIYAASKSRENSYFETGYKLDSNNWGPYNGWLLALVCILLAYSLMFSADLLNYANFKLTTSIPIMKEMYDVVIQAMQQLTGGPLWASLLVTAIFAPVFEEWLCRGMVLRGLLTRMKPGWAIVISALFFALIHFNPWQALNAFIIGMVMGFVYYRTGSLKLTMLLHFINNASAVVLAHMPGEIDEQSFILDLLPRSIYIPAYIAAVAVLIACLVIFARIPLKDKRGNMDEIPAE